MKARIIIPIGFIAILLMLVIGRSYKFIDDVKAETPVNTEMTPGTAESGMTAPAELREKGSYGSYGTYEIVYIRGHEYIVFKNYSGSDIEVLQLN